MYQYNKRLLDSRTFVNHSTRLEYIDNIIRYNDISCVDQLRMDKRTFDILFELLQNTRRIKTKGAVSAEEQVCMFLHIISHHVKNQTIRDRFFRSGETVSLYFNSVLNAVLQLHNVLLVTPNFLLENYSDSRWRWFKVTVRYNYSIAIFFRVLCYT